MTTTADILREHEKASKTDYISRDRGLLQQMMDSCYKKRLFKEGEAYRKAMEELDKKFGINRPIDIDADFQLL